MLVKENLELDTVVKKNVNFLIDSMEAENKFGNSLKAVYLPESLVESTANDLVILAVYESELSTKNKIEIGMFIWDSQQKLNKKIDFDIRFYTETTFKSLVTNQECPCLYASKVDRYL